MSEDDDLNNINLRSATSVKRNSLLHQSLSDLSQLNTSTPPSKKSISYRLTYIFEFLGFASIIYISSYFLDLSSQSGKSLMISICLSCFLLFIADIYFYPYKILSFIEIYIDIFIWPCIFSFLYIIAGISLETGLGLFNELYIMLYCLFVTLTSFIISLRKNSMSLSIISIIGGLSMPFIIEDAYDTSISVLYSSVVITFAIGLYLYHGWGLLLFISALGFWGSMYLHTILALSRQDFDIIRAMIFYQWILFWLSTAIHERFISSTINKKNNKQIAKLRIDFTNLVFQQRKMISFNLFILIACTHLLASTYVNIANWAPWGMLKGSLYFLASIFSALWERKYPPSKGCISLVYPNYVVGIVLLSTGVFIGLVGDQKYIALAIEACVVVLVSNHTNDWFGMIAGLGLWVYILIWSIYILVVTEPIVSVFNHDAMVQFIIIFFVAIQAHITKNIILKLIFEGLVHALCNMWLYREFGHTENYLYIVTALYPASVQIYAYFKSDTQTVTIIRMIFGDTLWLWLFLSQTLPRVLLITPDSPFPFFSFFSIVDTFVIGLAVQSALFQDYRLQGTTRWMYMVFCNATWISLIYREATIFNMTLQCLILYTIVILVMGFYWKSAYLQLGALLTITTLILDDLLLIPNQDILWKGILALFAGIIAVTFIFLPQTPDNSDDAIVKRAKQLSRSGSFNLSQMTFNMPPSTQRSVRASVSSPSYTILRNRSTNDLQS